VRGRPGISPAVLMLVTILQFVEQLTDRQAAQAVAGRIDWKYARAGACRSRIRSQRSERVSRPAGRP
jgi:Transposase domain (DUF772)